MLRTVQVVALLFVLPVAVVGLALWRRSPPASPAPVGSAPVVSVAPPPAVTPSPSPAEAGVPAAASEARPAPVSTPPVAAAESELPTSGLGLRVTFEALAGDGSVAGRDARIARLLALSVPAGSLFSPSLPPGRFRATFEGELEVDVRDRYELLAEGAGELELQIDGKPVLTGALREAAPVQARARLNKGKNRVVARYTSPVLGDARLRVSWSSSEFKPEAIAPMRWSWSTPDEVWLSGAAQRRGESVLAHAQCLACHAAEQAPARGPDLRAIGARVHPGWLSQWLARPQRDGLQRRHMPHLLDGPEAIADVVAYLGDLRGDLPALGAGDVAHGGRLFAHLGCVGCHTLPDAAPKPDRVSLAHLGKKWLPAGLAAFLREPARFDPGTAMPDFGLSEGEAAALTAFLLKGAAAAPAPARGDVARGAELVARSRCAACHELPGAAAPPAAAWSQVKDKLVAGADPCAGPPRYELSPGAARDLGKRAAAAWRGWPTAELAEQHVSELRCAACHARDGASDRFSAHASEVAGLLPPADPAHHEVDQTRPALTWVGEKLTGAALVDTLRGRAPRARPWLHARMPAFAAQAEQLAAGLAAEHGLPVEAADTKPDPARVSVGRDLVGAEKGFACVTCHGVGDQPPLQVFEVQGINFGLVSARLRRDFFLRWMRNPQRVDPATKMARYADAQGKTGLTHTFAGDAEQQFAAIWDWLSSLR